MNTLETSNIINKYRIKIYTRSFSAELYSLSKGLHLSEIPSVRLTDQSADGYFYTILKDTSCDIAINIDEDAFITDWKIVMDLVKLAIENDYANIGCPDGGAGCPRGGNPVVTNPFFNIFNLKLIRTKFIDKQQIQEFDFKPILPNLEANYQVDLLIGNWNFKSTDREPYYPFFFWLAFNFKTCYLHGTRHEDGISTILYDLKNRPFCFHSWFARFYKTPSFMVRFFQKNQGKQKKRIDALIDEAYRIRGLARPSFSSKDNAAFQFDLFKRWCIKVPQRITGWPKKLKKKYLRWKHKKD